jgi:hypothetical protein
LFASQQYSSSACSGNELDTGDLYVYYSEFHFVELGASFCVSASSAITEVSGAPLEACKRICTLLDKCVAFSHSQSGLCVTLSSNDFSAPCTPKPDRSLFISTRDAVGSDRPRYTYKRMSTCFNVSSVGNSSLGDNDTICEERCSNDTVCLGYQFSSQSKTCDTVSSKEGLRPLSCPSESNMSAYLRIDAYPYSEQNGTCLRNRIKFESNALIENVEKYECVALCEAHHSCRYVIHVVQGRRAVSIVTYHDLSDTFFTDRAHQAQILHFVNAFCLRHKNKF